MQWINNLRSGDEVYWNDPDNGICSRHMIIESIEIVGNTVCITDTEGNYLECFKNELK